MSRVKHLRVIAIAVAMVFLFSSVAFAAGIPKYVYFQHGSDMVKVDYDRAKEDAMFGDNTLYNAVKQYVGEAELTGAPVIVETDDQKILDYQKALGAGKLFADIVNDPAYQASKPDVQVVDRRHDGLTVRIYGVRCPKSSEGELKPDHPLIERISWRALPAQEPVANEDLLKEDFPYGAALKSTAAIQGPSLLVEIDTKGEPVYNIDTSSTPNHKLTYIVKIK